MAGGHVWCRLPILIPPLRRDQRPRRRGRLPIVRRLLTAVTAQSAAPSQIEYVAHIVLAQTYIVTDTGPVALEPGMAVTADVKTGRRRVISYLLSPFAHQIKEAGRDR